MVFEGDSLKDYVLDFKDKKLVKVELPNIQERKVGKWLVNEDKDTICCPFCNRKQKIGTAEVELLDTIFTSFNFCKYCGARNEAY